jgi:serine protease
MCAVRLKALDDYTEEGTMRPIVITLTSLALCALAATQLSAAEYNPALHRPSAAEAPVSHRFIVKMRATDASRLQAQASQSGESAATAAAMAAGAERVKALAARAHVTMNASRALTANLHVMEVTAATAAETEAQTLESLRNDPDVEYAVSDRRVYPHSTLSTDPLAATNQWYLQAVQPSAINAIGAWDTTKGSDDVVIAVIDTGVRFDHPDLTGRLLAGYDFVSGDSNGSFKTANDSNGRDSDASDPGDWVTSADACGKAEDSSWHGTRTSGIIGAMTNNGAGVAGITWNARILPVRVLGKCGGFNSDVLAGMLWAAGRHVDGVPDNATPARVLNISLGGEGSCDSASADVTSQLASQGVLIVVSAGNEGGPVDSPANCPGAMGILGLRHAGTKVGFSSLGPEIALGAPGGNCVNTGAGEECVYSIGTTTNLGTTTPGTNSYTNKLDHINVGTSFSAPIVSGIAGLMLAVNSNLKSTQLIARLKEGASPYPTTSDSGTVPTCHVPTSSNDIQNTECICTTAACGAGMANANNSVLAALRPIANVIVQGAVSPGATLTLQGGGSTAANSHTIASYSWMKGGTVISTGPTASVTAPSSGTSSVCLTVTDDAGKVDTAKVAIGTSSSTVSLVPAGANACSVDVSVSATDATASEVGGDTGTFTFTRSGDTTAALTVSFSMSGSAVNGTDYQTIGSTVTFAVGSATATVTVTPIDNTAAGGSKTVTATVSPGTGYTPASPGSATVTIADNDTANATSNGGGGGGGGGALDELTLMSLALGVLAMLARGRSPRHAQQLRQHVGTEQRRHRR